MLTPSRVPVRTFTLVREPSRWPSRPSVRVVAPDDLMLLSPRALPSRLPDCVPEFWAEPWFDCDALPPRLLCVALLPL